MLLSYLNFWFMMKFNMMMECRYQTIVWYMIYFQKRTLLRQRGRFTPILYQHHYVSWDVFLKKLLMILGYKVITRQCEIYGIFESFFKSPELYPKLFFSLWPSGYSRELFHISFVYITWLWIWHDCTLTCTMTLDKVAYMHFLKKVSV